MRAPLAHFSMTLPPCLQQHVLRGKLGLLSFGTAQFNCLILQPKLSAHLKVSWWGRWPWLIIRFQPNFVSCKYLRRAMDWRNHWFEGFYCTSIILVRWSQHFLDHNVCVFDYNNRACIHLAIYYCDCRTGLYGENRLEVHVTPIYILVLKQVMYVLCVTYVLSILNTQHCPIKYPIYKNLFISRILFHFCYKAMI